MPGGRKSLKEEIKIIERLTALSEPTFKFIKEQLEGGDKKWAAEQMMKLYAKCIPTELASDPENPFILQISKEIADKNGINTSTSNDSEGHTSA